MTADSSGFERRSVLKMVGAALGGAVASQSAGAVQCRQLAVDYKVYTNCPPVGDPTGPVVEAGASAFEACTGSSGAPYYSVFDSNGSGYVPESATEPC